MMQHRRVMQRSCSANVPSALPQRATAAAATQRSTTVAFAAAPQARRGEARSVTVVAQAQSTAGAGAAAAPMGCRRVLDPSIRVPYGMDLASYPSMEGKNMLLTGGSRGLGLCSARLLAYLGAHVYLADVDTAALERAVQQLRREVSGAQVTACPQLDLGKQSSVHAFADWWLSLNQPLHVLINNAGANFMGIEPWYTEQGVAGLPQVNFVGPYTLTRRLVGCMESTAAAGASTSAATAGASAAGTAEAKATGRARIVNLCSVMHRFSSLPEDPQFFLKDWWIGGSYRNCKLALTMTTALLQQRLASKGIDSVSVDPGAVYSGIWSTSRVFGRPPGSTVISALFATPEDACATTVHAAASATVEPGGYYARGLFARGVIVRQSSEPLAGVFSCVDWPLRSVSGGALAARLGAVPVAPHATQLAPAEALWDACADLAGLPRGV